MFGGLDGIITLLAIVASISGSDLDVETILVLGFAELVGDGISMGICDFYLKKLKLILLNLNTKKKNGNLINIKKVKVKR